MELKQAKLLLKHENLTNILVEIEDMLDSMDLYVFDNWFDGEIYYGPEVRRYWVDVTLMYPYEKMPDPDGAVRLRRNNIEVTYSKKKIKKTIQTDFKNGNQIQPDHKPKTVEEEIWLIKLSIPRKFVSELDDDDLQIYSDDSVDKDSVSDARDQNVDDTDAFVDNMENDGEF